ENKDAYPRDIFSQRARVHPLRNLRCGERQQSEARETCRREHQEGVEDVSPWLMRCLREKVKQAFRYSKLPDHVERGKNQKELFIDAELGLIEEPCQHDRDKKRRHEGQDSS